MAHAPEDPAVKAAYEDLIRQTVGQYEALAKSGYKFWFIDTRIPSNAEYASSPWNALRDMRSNQQMGVFPTTDGFGSSEVDVSKNPLLADTGIKWPVGGVDGPLRPVLANDLFRAVHDAFGHGIEGSGFRAQGEENAWQAHIRLFTGPARGAITTETRGQNSWLNYGPYGERNRTAKTEDTVFADQKTGLMPEWTWTEGRAADEATTSQGEVGAQRYMPATIQREVGRNVDFANPPTEEKAKAALSSSKQPFWREHESLPEGSPVGVRIDIPAFLNRGTYVQTIHEPATPGNVGDRIGYDTNVRLSGPVRFFVKEGSEESKLGAVAIKEGRAAKHPIATVEGRLIKDRSIPSDIETWTPVGMDPKKHSYFYDKRTDQPVTGGSESFSVGNTVFVKNPVYGKPQDFRYMPQPDSAMPGAYSFQGGYRAIPGKTKGSFRLYGPAGSLIGIASSLDEAQRILRRKAKQ